MQTELVLSQNPLPSRRSRKTKPSNKIFIKQALIFMLAGFTLCGDCSLDAKTKNLDGYRTKQEKLIALKAYDYDIEEAIKTIRFASIVNNTKTAPKLSFNKDIGVPILMIHKVLNNDDDIKNPKLEISINHFKNLLNYIRQNGYTTISLTQLSDFLYNQKPIPEKSIVLTFDDGYYIGPAIDLLKEYNMHADLGIITNAREKGNITNPKSYYSWEQLKSLASDSDGDYVDIVSHTHTHMYFRKDKSYSQIEGELLKSSEKIENYTGTDCDIVIYPGGFFSENKDNITKAAKKIGYRIGVTTTEGLNYYGQTNPFALKRYEVNQIESIENLFKQIDKDKLKYKKSKK